MDSVSPFMKLLANYLEPFDSNKTMELAAETGTILAKELNPKEQAIIGNIFIMIGSILTKTSHNDDEQKNKWQHAREAKFELSEIEMETQNLQKRLDKLRKSLVARLKDNIFLTRLCFFKAIGTEPP